MLNFVLKAMSQVKTYKLNINFEHLMSIILLPIMFNTPTSLTFTGSMFSEHFCHLPISSILWVLSSSILSMNNIHRQHYY